MLIIEKWLCLIKGRQGIREGDYSLFIRIEALERSLGLLDRKIQEYTGQRLIEKWEGWMKERHG